jgi:hypothetical protein
MLRGKPKQSAARPAAGAEAGEGRKQICDAGSWLSGSKPPALAALTRALSFQEPVRQPSCLSEKHIRGSHRKKDALTVSDRRYWPGNFNGD